MKRLRLMRKGRKGEKGFTLIELLVVVAILGVLAAVAIPNVGRFIGKGEDEASATEKANIQTAVIAMMVDNGLSAIPNPVNVAGGAATQTMTAFPDATSTVANAGKVTDPEGYAYADATDTAGYLLYTHDITGSAVAGPNPDQTDANYLATNSTEYFYTCEGDGTVRQWDDAAMTTELNPS